MEYFIKDTSVQSLLVCLIFCLPLLGRCHKNNREDDATTIALSEILENPDYVNLPLIGTKWKLVGFADGRTGQIKLAEPSEGDSYTLIFG